MYENTIQYSGNIPKYPPPLSTHQAHTSKASGHPSIQFVTFQSRLNQYLAARTACNHISHQHKAISQQHSYGSKIKLSDVTAEMSQCYELTDKLKIELNDLANAKDTLTDAQWNERIAIVEHKKVTLVNLTEKYNDQNVQENIKNALKRRKKKRENIKKRKRETMEMKRFQIEKRLRIHQKIDKYLEANAHKLLKERQRIDAEQRAEEILAGVKKRKTEARKYITLIDSLIELHHVRCVQKGSDEHSEKELKRQLALLQTMWTDAIQNYEQEEEQLRKFLKTQDQYIGEWRNVLFGCDESVAIGTNPFLKSENSIKELIRIRRSWDKCIVPKNDPFGSTIPLGWITPNKNSSEKWKIYRQNNDSDEILKD